METRTVRELTLDEMDKVSGGLHDEKENRRYEIFEGVQCPHCSMSFSTERELKEHIAAVHSSTVHS